MSIHYSPARDAFLDARLHTDLPADAIPVSAQDHTALLQARTAGLTITVQAGRPVAVQPTVPIDRRRAQRLASVKLEAARRILATASLVQQANDNAAIAMAALAGGGSDAVADAIDRRLRIDAIRTASNVLEATIATLSARRLDALDVTADHHWPA